LTKGLLLVSKRRANLKELRQRLHLYQKRKGTAENKTTETKIRERESTRDWIPSLVGRPDNLRKRGNNKVGDQRGARGQNRGLLSSFADQNGGFLQY